jgi:single-strand DNA-binding protein
MANTINKVILMGNLTRDPQLKFLPSQTAVAEFGIACNRKFRTQSGEDRDEVTFVDCSAFGKTGETISKYFQKGRQILIEGRLKYDSWEDKQGGGKRSKLTVVIDQFYFVGGPRDGQGGGGGHGGEGGHEADGGHGGGGGGYDEAPPRRSAPPPQSRGPAPQRPAPQRPPAQQEPPPYSDEQQFKDDDIPF